MILRRSLRWIVVAAAIGACASPLPVVTLEPSASSGSSPVFTDAASALPSAAATPPEMSPRPTYPRRPLALALAGPTTLDGLATGTLRVTQECVWLEDAERQWLLIWPSDRTSWDEVGSQLVFTNDSGGEVAAQDGSTVRVGGGLAIAQDGDDWMESVSWIVAPADGCPLERGWWVHGLAVEV